MSLGLLVAKGPGAGALKVLDLAAAARAAVLGAREAEAWAIGRCWGVIGMTFSASDAIEMAVWREGMEVVGLVFVTVAGALSAVLLGAGVCLAGVAAGIEEIGCWVEEVANEEDEEEEAEGFVERVEVAETVRVWRRGTPFQWKTRL
jgi:hypothetical protein